MKRSLTVVFAVLLLALSGLAQQPMNLSQVGAAAVSLGSKTSANSIPVVIASDQASIPVAATLNAETTKVIGEVNQGTSPWVVNVSQINGVTALMGNGVTGTGSQRVTIASDNTAFQVKILGNSGAIFDFAGQNAAQPANSILIGGEFNTTPTTLTTGNASPLQLDSSGKLLVNCTGCSAGSTVQLIPGTSGGLTMSHLLLAATNNATSLKASAGQLYGASVYNNAAYPIYLKFYNKATAPAPATDTVVYEVPVQAGTERQVHSDEGLAFATGIAYAVVKGISDTDNTSVAASDGSVDLIYK